LSKSLRLLIADDRRDVAWVLKALLTRAGHEVDIVQDGESCLERAREIVPHAIISDIALEGSLDGYDLARAVRADASIAASYLIALTGYCDDEHRRLAREAGFDRYFVKPIPIHELLKILDEISP
jgi:DNA-binding response OmpR family regulator